MNKAVLDKNNIAISTGSIVVFNYDAITLEYLNSTDEHLSVGIGLPANSCTDAPPDPQEGYVICRSSDLTNWLIVPDYRGKIAYNTQTGKQQEIIELGELPEILTFKQPATDFDKWDDEKWVTDIEAQKNSQIEQVELQRATLRQHANEAMTLLQYAVETEMASDAEKALLLAWKKYLVLLSRVDTSITPDIDWPQVPE
ncbi:tail fiber assembly protein [Photorhabdus heterorhabditis]|uniref:Phage tail protein n=1 Tax=Photorhabdus heterorhabditis TaxID=880156 RepID=A0A5B0VCY2_9GAMM|nr:tail fiber assembly protein [Photorhabdus heterorhabditis]KAA1172566.1 tail fiber assembly protein [Photorhabdus heterorhabditis]KOY62090.1 phage tail protein [Photorhabdus heterorhabditis]MBS9443144.1 tail fiber assembly protein [Photorhabdus heterorhabditis]